MNAPAKLDLNLSPGARKWLDKRATSTRSYEPTLGLLHSIDKDGRDYWSCIVYSPENIASMENDYGRFGGSVLRDVAGLVLAIPQLQRLNELKGALLDVEAGRLVLRAG